MKGIFGNLFDFNHDGELDVFERTAEFQFLDKMIRDEEQSDELEADGFDSDDCDF